jgi:hypothetical protein
MKLHFEPGEYGDYLPFAVVIINPEKQCKLVVMKITTGHAGYSTEEGVELCRELLGDRIGTIENEES